jgi:hypothetical protein
VETVVWIQTRELTHTGNEMNHQQDREENGTTLLTLFLWNYVAMIRNAFG